jgi:hypothetical protein
MALDKRQVQRIIDSSDLPYWMRKPVMEIAGERLMNDALSDALSRKGQFSSALTALMLGVAGNEQSRRHINKAMDEHWAAETGLYYSEVYDEIIVGGGAHAAIYAAARVAAGNPPPLVLEGSSRVGGAFAVSHARAFYLNSRNRPGPLGLPGDGGALNVLPGSMIQPADLSGDEYQVSSDLGYAVRMTLAMNAEVRSNRLVTTVARRADDYSGDYIYEVQFRTSGGVTGTARARQRVIVATGLGDENRGTLLGWPDAEKSGRAVTFAQFMRKMEEPFPLRGMKRVAVIGTGDSGKTVIEALVGQGPSSRLSVASLDRPERIDWYGFTESEEGYPDDRYYCRGWESNNRSRYKGIGRVLPRDSDGMDYERALVRPYSLKAQQIGSGYECVYVNGRPYDYAILCAGWSNNVNRTISLPTTPSEHARNGVTVGKKCTSRKVYVVGPAADLPFEDQEIGASPKITSIPENKTALFRYAGKTAALAVSVKPSDSNE